MHQVRKRLFPLTAGALMHFDATQPKRDVAWKNAASNEDVERAQEADRLALAVVQQAYYLDTEDINSADNCARVDLAFMRRMVKESKPEPETDEAPAAPAPTKLTGYERKCFNDWRNP